MDKLVFSAELSLLDMQPEEKIRAEIKPAEIAVVRIGL